MISIHNNWFFYYINGINGAVVTLDKALLNWETNNFNSG